MPTPGTTKVAEGASPARRPEQLRRSGENVRVDGAGGGHERSPGGDRQWLTTLQDAVGNRASAGLLDGAAEPGRPVPPEPANSEGGPALPGVLARRGRPEDDADRFGNEAVDGLLRERVTGSVPVSSRLRAPSGSFGAVPEAIRAVLTQPGTPLPARLSAGLSSMLQTDLTPVRLHTDAEAGATAEGLDAEAYTVGRHIVLGPSAARLSTRGGLQTLAHEAAHVAQQSASGSALIQRKAKAEAPAHDDPYQDPDVVTILAAAARAKTKPGAIGIVGAEIAYRLISKFLEHYVASIAGIGHKEGVSGVVASKSKSGGVSLDLGRDWITGVDATNLAARTAQIEAALKKVGAKARKDYVFIMGTDRAGQPNQFYAAARAYYRAKLPDATMIDDRNNLEAVLTYVASVVKEPVNSVYLVSHANEDGTLSFPLNASDTDNKTAAAELKAALRPAAGKTALPDVRKNIDVYSSIRIKGCDIGRTQQMVELLDEAFGGEGDVTAPTHEQHYGFDDALSKKASKEFREGVAAEHAKPELDAALLKKNPVKAKANQKAAMKKWHGEVMADIASKSAEETAAVEKASVLQEFSGPMFQRPGTTLYVAADLKPEVATLYTQLTEKEQGALVKALIAPDKRPAAQQQTQGTYTQQGQRLDRKRLDFDLVPELKTLKQALTIFKEDESIKEDGWAPSKLLSAGRDATGTTVAVEIERQRRVKGQKAPEKDTWSWSKQVKTADELIASSKTRIGNPERYSWRLDETNVAGMTRLTAVGERVMTYLHHRPLRKKGGGPFDRPESDPRFFARSTFSAPPPPQPAPLLRRR